MGNSIKAKITYSALGDLLSIWTGISKGGAQIVTMQPDCSSFYAREGQKCVGIYWYDAGSILLPLLERNDTSEADKYPELLVNYSRETDILAFGNRKTAARKEAMAPGIVSHIDPAGLANRFTMERASDILLPLLKQDFAVKTS